MYEITRDRQPGNNRWTAIALAGFFLALPLAGAIPLLERGPQHETLDFLIGDWDVETNRFLPAKLEVVSRVTYSWKYDGSWLEEYDPTELEGTGTIHNVMLMAYDDRVGVWRGAWLDNVSPTMIRFQARWIDAETFELDTGDIVFAGRPHRALATYRRLSECTLRRTLEWSWDGADLELAAVSEFDKIGCPRPEDSVSVPRLVPETAGRSRPPGG